MFFNRILLGLAGIVLSVSLPVSLLSVNVPVSAQVRCTPLKVVGGSGFQVRKKISQPIAVPGVNTNYNTDFIVPDQAVFTRYVATITAENAATYNITMFLKYNNNTAKQVYNGKDVYLAREQPLRIEGKPTSTNNQPYQVNLLIRGDLNNTYRASVSGCR